MTPEPSNPDDWRNHAACRGVDTALFFPDRGGDSRQAKQVCRECPVVDPCRETGQTEYFGVWGGLSERQRRGTRGPTIVTYDVVRSIDHGTDSGYRAHQRRGEFACPDCLRAHADYNARYRPPVTHPEPVAVTITDSEYRRHLRDLFRLLDEIA